MSYTAQELAMYLGCEVEYGFEGRKKNGQLVGRDERYGWQVFDPSNAIVPYHFVKDDLITLKLRPMSDLTEEEKIEIAKIVCNDPAGMNDYEYEEGYNTVYVEIRGLLISRMIVFGPEGITYKQACIDGGNLSIKNIHAITKKLIEWQIDVFGYIAEGKAIDKTKM